jgi:WD40-like Beta Propeller Repeat
MKRRTLAALAVMLVAVGLCSAAVAGMGKFSGWSAAVRVEAIPCTDLSFNGPDLDGCPFISRDGKKFFMASNRPGGLGGIDIWLSTRARKGDPWGAPVNVGAPVNSSANDFCPTLARDGRNFYFVSNRAGGCGGADMYTAQRSATGTFGLVTNLGCQVQLRRRGQPDAASRARQGQCPVLLQYTAGRILGRGSRSLGRGQ